MKKKGGDGTDHQEPMGFCNQDSRKVHNNPPKNMNPAESSWAHLVRQGIPALSPAQPSSLELCCLLAEESPRRHSLLKETRSIKLKNMCQGRRPPLSSSILCFLLSSTGGHIFIAFSSAVLTPQTQQEPKWSLKSLNQPLLAPKGGTSTLFLASF